jgi:hypothetical protein
VITILFVLFLICVIPALLIGALRKLTGAERREMRHRARNNLKYNDIYRQEEQRRRGGRW